MAEFTVDDLRRVMRAAAGEAEGVSLDGPILDLTFEELSYDSLALLETASRIERETGITFPDGVINDLKTPRDLLTLVNSHLAGNAG